MESILTSIKKLLGLTEEDTSFDQDVIMHINTVLMDLTLLKVGPSTGFIIEDKTSVWTDFVKNPTSLPAIKSYIYLRVRMLFDPPSSAAAVASMEKQIDKFEWLINVAAESENSGIIDENSYEEIKALINDLKARIEALEQGSTSETNHSHNNKDVLDMFGINVANTRPTFGGTSQSHVLATLDDVGTKVNFLRKDLEEQISLIPKFAINVVDELPTTDINYSAIYLIKDSETSGNLYTEYIYVKGKWEKIGSTSVDVDIPTTEEIVDAVLEALETAEGGLY